MKTKFNDLQNLIAYFMIITFVIIFIAY